MSYSGLPDLARRGFCLLALSLVAAFTVGAGQAAVAGEDVWSELKGELYGDRPIQDGSEWLALDAPYRAYDAAIVPIDITALRPQGATRFIKNITLVIDQNPAPVAAVFRLGPRSGLASISTRVRIDAYSNVRAIVETNDGELFMVSRFVKASGGCAAPALKDQDESLANLGKMRLRYFTPKPSASSTLESQAVREAQLMIRHPNYSGLQMNQITRYYIPAFFVRDIEVRQGDDLILSIEGAISLSENPSVRFNFLSSGAEPISVRVQDSEDQIFTQSWPVSSPAS